MPGFPIRLLALDIDGTLVSDDLAIGRRTREAVAAARERGVLVSLVTGRMATSAVRFARELGLTEPIVALQGALIREMPQPGSTRRGRLLVHRPMSAEAARDACRWSAEHGLDPHVNHLEWLVLPRDDPRADDYSLFLGGRLRLVPDVARWIDRPVTKVISVGDEPAPMEAFPQAIDAFAGRAGVTVSHPRFLEFLAPGVSKGRAVRWLARRSGVPLSQAMAIGDQHNDLEMIADVGHGVAMPTAPVAVRSAARYVAPPLEQEGAAQMIEELILGGRRSDAHMLPGPPTWESGSEDGPSFAAASPQAVTGGDGGRR